MTAEILHEAKEQDAINRARVESKIEGLESDLEHLKSDVGRDLKNLKELYSNDVRNIADKIENLRDELSTQHSNMLALLTRLVDKD